MKDTVLITGAAGFIGSHLVARMLCLGYRVVGLDNFDDFYSPAIKRKNIESIEGEDSFVLIEGDVRDTSLLRRVFSANRIKVVVHLAARAGVRPSLEQPILYEDNNVGGTVTVLEMSRAHGVKQFVFASSSSVYGINSKAPFDEAQIPDPISPYAASKASAELFCHTYSHLYGLPVVVLRLFTVYGPRQRPEMAIHRFVSMVDRGEEVILFGDGTTKRDFTYIDDIISGFEAALSWQGNTFGVFNLGRGNAVDLVYLMNLIEGALGKKARVRRVAAQQGEVPLTLANISKARSMLGYQPKISVEEGVPLFVKWYLNNGGATR